MQDNESRNSETNMKYTDYLISSVSNIYSMIKCLRLESHSPKTP